MSNSIKKVRSERGVTLQQLAERSGFSKGYLSKVERAEGYPPFSTLQTLAGALGVDLDTLLERGARDGSSPKSGASGGSLEISPPADSGFYVSEEGYAYRPLVSGARKYMSPFVMRVPKGKTGRLKHDGEEFVYVVSGNVTLHYEGRKHELAAGQGLYLDSRLPHRFENRDDEDAELLAVEFAYRRF